MPSLKTLCAELFGKDDLYAVLGAEKTASAAELKKSYYRLSLRLHPDRVEERDKDDSTAKFQVCDLLRGWGMSSYLYLFSVISFLFISQSHFVLGPFRPFC